MQKIPTLFERDKPPWRRPVTPGVKPECLWVAAGEGIATRKLDGINVKVVDGIPVRGENVVGPSRAGDLVGDLVDVAVPVPPGLIVPENRVRILLPAGYDPMGPGYPVVYLLHGAGDTYETWSQNTDVIDFSAAFPVIIVMPDGGRNADAGWYSDWKDGSRQWESFHIDVLVPFIDATYRTLGDGHRAVMGLSMGGFGTMSYTARHPSLFAVLCADADHELAAHDGDGVAVGVAVDRDANRWPLARAKRLDHIIGNPDTDSGLSALE